MQSQMGKDEVFQLSDFCLDDDDKGRRCRVSRYEILSFLSFPKKIHISPVTGVHPIIYFTGGFSSLPTKDALPDIDSNLLTCANTCGAVRRSRQHL